MATPVKAQNARNLARHEGDSETRCCLKESSRLLPIGMGLGVGAGAGFGLGLWAGLAWFDDATNSDQKVWGTAIGFSIAGGVIGVLVGRSVGGDNGS